MSNTRPENPSESAQGRQPKYLDLLEINGQINDIYQHINDLNMKLGVINRNESKIAPSPTAPLNIPKTPVPESLVSVLDQLPDMVSAKVTQIHNLLDSLAENLT